MSHITPKILLGIALLLLLVTIAGNHGLLHLQKINNELRQLEGKNLSLQSEITALEHRIFALQNDDAELERVAREELGLSRTGEIVYIFPQTQKKSAVNSLPGTP